MSKLNAKQERKIRAKDRKWKKENRTVDLFAKRVKKDVRNFMDSLMFNKRPKTAVDRMEHYLIWWSKIIIIFCALMYIFK